MVPLLYFTDIKKQSTKKRNNWMILDNQFFTFEGESKVYSVTDLLTLRYHKLNSEPKIMVSEPIEKR